MTDRTSPRENRLNTISRRYLLRNSAMAATGAVLLPSFITGCSKNDDAPQGGLGSVGDTPSLDQLKAAADNINRMRTLFYDLYRGGF